MQRAAIAHGASSSALSSRCKMGCAASAYTTKLYAKASTEPATTTNQPRPAHGGGWRRVAQTLHVLRLRSRAAPRREKNFTTKEFYSVIEVEVTCPNFNHTGLPCKFNASCRYAPCTNFEELLETALKGSVYLQCRNSSLVSRLSFGTEDSFCAPTAGDAVLPLS